MFNNIFFNNYKYNKIGILIMLINIKFKKKLFILKSISNECKNINFKIIICEYNINELLIDYFMHF